ncbi:hypothetical protein, partial [Phascolarctobacterium faecium]|uniref:hypothetical protein n=1 Tax=Phascolarctobacterium faecium TaxID=33025 RepID=UPI003AB1ABE9
KQWRYGYYFRIAIVFSVDSKLGGLMALQCPLVSDGKCGMKAGQSRVKSRRPSASEKRHE